MTPLSPAQTRHVRRETLISIAINAALSALFCVLVFHGRSLIAPREIVFDALPQSFMIALMTTIVPTLLTRRRLRSGSLERIRSGPALLPRNLLGRALVVAALAAAGGFALSALIVPRIAASWSFEATLIFKVAYGGLLASLCAPILLRTALADT
ncbi:MAG: hypothetical protein JWO25_579 [Alphaproteobacteria bacterium]|nr:hypothetical protein [Alphaproteobacteria bacterium]